MYQKYKRVSNPLSSRATIFVIRDRKVKMIPYYMYYIFDQFLTLNIFNQFNHDITEVTADIYYLSLNVF